MKRNKKIQAGRQIAAINRKLTVRRGDLEAFTNGSWKFDTEQEKAKQINYAQMDIADLESCLKFQTEIYNSKK